MKSRYEKHGNSQITVLTFYAHVAGLSKYMQHTFKRGSSVVRKIFITFTTVSIFTFSTQTLSFDGWLNAHLASFHHQSEFEYNEKNIGLGLALPTSPELDLLIGFYENSYNKNSVYAGFKRHTANNYGFSVGIAAILVSGYDETRYGSGKVIPTFMPQLTYTVKNIRVEVGVIPSFGKRDYTAISTLTVGSRF